MKTISDSELPVIRFIWDQEESGRKGVPFADIVGNVGQGKAKQTINTLLRRLEAKGYIRTERNPRKKLYYSTVSRTGYVAMFSEEVIPGTGEKVENFLDGLSSSK